MNATREGIGLYRGPAEAIPDDLTPGQPPHPSEGRQGPPASIPLEGWERTKEAIDELGRTRALASRPDQVVDNASGNTDGSGNAILSVYQVAAGMEARLTRLTVNALVAATGLPYTAAAPYASAGAYLEIHDVENESQVGFSSLMDFAPPIAGGPIFPGLFTDELPQASMVRGPKMFVLKIVTGPVSTQVMCRYEITLSRAKGIA